MTFIANVTSGELVERNEHYELVYITLRLFIGTLSALVASLLKFRRRRLNDTAALPSVHGAGSRSDRLR